MSFTDVFQFLDDLQENNNKSWMDENRKRYKSIRSFIVSWLDQMNEQFSKIDPQYTDTSGKKAINRINNNLLYHPNLPTYKDHFGAGLDQITKMGDFYIQIGSNRSFVAGGYWKPTGDLIKSIREGIDYNGDLLKKILSEKTFKKTFGELLDKDEALVKTPQGYEADHPHIDLLKMRTFAVLCPLSRKDVCSVDFNEQCIELYKTMLPFRRYLNQAASF